MKEPTPSQRERALRKSIAHWRRMARGNLLEDQPTWAQCELCRLYNTEYHSNYNRCIGCPVYAATGWSGCRETPYENASERWEMIGPKADQDHEFLKHSWKEVKFLESLLPKTKTKKGKTCKKK